MEKVSLQLYSIRDYVGEDFIGSIKKVARMGYTGVEFAGYGGLCAEELKSLLAENGLEAVSTHIGLEALTEDADKEINYAKEAGIPVIICPYVYITTEQEALILCEKFSGIIEKCKKAGIAFGYHNHAHEFKVENDKYLLDILFENTPDLVCELDVYWAEYAGIKVLDYMKKYKGRLPLIHLKELGENKSNPDFGKGLIDFPKVVELAKSLGTKEFIVEQEEYEVDSMLSAANNLEYLKRL